MRLLGWSEWIFDAKVDVYTRLAEPDAAPALQDRRLGDLVETQSFDIERACFILATLWHGELDMMK